MSFTFSALVCVSVTFLLGCSKPQTPTGPVVAKVGDTHISLDEFQRELQSRTPQPTPEQREAALQDMIRTETLYLRAKEAGFDMEPETKARVRKLIASAYEQKLRSGPKSTTNSISALDNYYREHASEFMSPERTRVAAIFLRVSPKATAEKKDEAVQKAQIILTEAKLLPSTVSGFGHLAQQYSEDQSSRYAGGDLGSLTQRDAETRLGPEMANEIFKYTQPGELFGPIQSPQGVYLFKVMAREESKAKPFNEVKDLVAYKVARAAEEADQRAFDERLRAGLKIEINRSAVDSVKAVPMKDSAPPANVPGE